MPLSKALVGHGIFTEYSVNNALGRFARYGAPAGAPAPTDAQRIDRFIHALKDMGISTVWMQLFTTNHADVELMDGPDHRGLRSALIAALNQAQIAWAGWGYCAGANSRRDVDLIAKFRDDLHMKAFVIDAEPHDDGDVWTATDFDTLTAKVNGLFGAENLGLSTWPVLQLQDSATNPVIKYMQIAAPRVGVFAPQVYWMDFPGDVHYAQFAYDKYPRADPVAMTRLVIDAWQGYRLGQPLVITGQAYWQLAKIRKEGGTPSAESMAAKIYQFAKHFTSWSQIVGLNWYHAGLSANTELSGSMSDEMVAQIAAGQFGARPYRAA
jgi:hypothetical protein